MIANVWFCTTIAILLVICHGLVTHRNPSFTTSPSFFLKRPQGIRMTSHIHTSQQLPTLYEVNRRYAVRANDAQYIVDSGSKGRAGVIFDLDTALANVEKVVGYSYAILAGELGAPTPNPANVRDSLGCTVVGTLIALGITVPDTELVKVEQRLFAITLAMVEKLPVARYPGAARLVDELLADGNDVVVVSSFPLSVAKKMMGKSGLAEYFENRVSGDHFLCYEPDSHEAFAYGAGERCFTQQLVQSCVAMRKPPLLCTVVSGNHRHVLTSKRSGFSVVAVTGGTIRSTCEGTSLF
jgi:hypothetical protein